jgi:hypothetical protein
MRPRADKNRESWVAKDNIDLLRRWFVNAKDATPPDVHLRRQNCFEKPPYEEFSCLADRGPMLQEPGEYRLFQKDLLNAVEPMAGLFCTRTIYWGTHGVDDEAAVTLTRIHRDFVALA